MTDDTLLYRGKSKDVYRIMRGPFKDKIRLVFTDKATGYIDNGQVVFDPGRDVVVGEIAGKGAIACQFATYFFKLLQQHGIPSHYIDTIGANEMIVEPALPLSMAAPDPDLPGAAPLQNLEFTWRNNATGSFWRRYPFVKPCKNLNLLVEIWTKGEVDTLITREALAATGALGLKEIDSSIELVSAIARLVSQEFATKGLHVLDGKFELGRLAEGDGQIVIIDEISPDVLRVCKGFEGDAHGDCIHYKTCTVTTCVDDKRSIKNLCQVKPEAFVNVFW